jgi:hypothetical protein
MVHVQPCVVIHRRVADDPEIRLALGGDQPLLLELGVDGLADALLGK